MPSFRRSVFGAVIGAMVVAVATVAVVSLDRSGAQDSADADGIWVSRAELMNLPTTGSGWENVLSAAEADWGLADISDQDSRHDTSTLAGAYVATRLDDDTMRSKTVAALRSVEGSTSDNLLALARNLPAYVFAADVIGYDSPDFATWLSDLIDRPGTGRAGLDSLRAVALHDPSNHGTHARAAVLAVALFVGDDRVADDIAGRFHDWLGRSGRDFEWRELDWQADPMRPAGINPPNSTIDGTDVDGVLPEEQRRSGPFANPAPQEGYVWEGLQGAVVTAEVLDRAGHNAWQWESSALWRAYRWLYEVNDFPASGDDDWQPWIVNAAYDQQLPTVSPTRVGKNMSFTDWTHGAG